MANTLKLKRGLETNRSGQTPAAGEPLWTTDGNRLFIGDGATAGGIEVAYARTGENESITGTWTFTNSVTLDANGALSDIYLNLDADDGENNLIRYLEDGVVRWAEGKNINADWGLFRYNSSGIFQDTPISVAASTGNVSFDNIITVDEINEETAAVGVTVDGVLLQDGRVTTTNQKAADFNYAGANTYFDLSETLGTARFQMLSGSLAFGPQSAGKNIQFKIGGSVIYRMTETALYPETNDAETLGQAANVWSNIYSSAITTDQIDELTATAGVTIDGVLLKDGAGTYTSSVQASAFYGNYYGNVAATGGGRGFAMGVSADRVYLAPTDQAGGYQWDKEFTFDAAGDGVWTAEGGFKTTGALSVDTINESTASAGVTIDSVLLKDGQVTADNLIQIDGAGPQFRMVETDTTNTNAEFYLNGGVFYIREVSDSYALNHVSFYCALSGSTILYHNGANRVQTTSSGVTLTGTALVNTINEATTDTGVTIEGTLFENDNVTSPGNIISQRIAANANLGLKRANGTLGSETQTLTNDVVGVLFWESHSGTAYNGAGARIDGIAATNGSASRDLHMAFKTSGSDAAPAERMRITSAGLIGIGETDPDTVLHVKGDQYPLTKIERTSASGAGLELTNTLGTASVGIGSSGNAFLSTSYATGYINFSVNSSEVMRLTADDRVGIGLTDPEVPLEVLENIRVRRADGTDPKFTTTNKFAAVDTAIIGSVRFNGVDSSATAVNAVQIRAIGRDTWTSTAGTRKAALGFLVNNGSSTIERMRIDYDGTVNIQQTLEVDTINEDTVGAGVTIDGVLIKDGLVDGVDVSSIGGLTMTTEKTGSYTASAGERVPFDISAAATLTLPSSPSVGDQVGFLDVDGGFGSNTLTVARNGSNIMGSATNMTVNVSYARGVLEYLNATHGWVLV